MASAVDDTKPANGAAIASNDIRANMVIIKSEISALQTGVGGSLALTGGTLSGPLIISDATASTSTITGALRVVGGIGTGGAIWAGSNINASGAAGESTMASSSFLSTFVSNTAGLAPSNTLRRGRGTAIGSPSAVSQNDELGRFAFAGYSGAAYTTGTVIIGTVIEPTPGASAFGTRTAFWQCPTGSGSVSELERKEHATGFSSYGANVYLDQNRCFQNRTATLGTLHIASAAGKQEFATDLGGGAGLLINDGTNTKRMGDGGYTTVATNADFTLTVLTSAVNQRHTGTLTADRAVTLSTSGAYAGSEFLITRTGPGAFNLNIGTGPLKALATNTWCRVVYDGSAWYLASYGAL